MTKNSDELILGYDLDKWKNYGDVSPILTDISTKTNSHILIVGMSGSGKSYAENIILARLGEIKTGTIYFADYKLDESFSYLRRCPRYYPYEKTFDALKLVYEIMQKRLAGDDVTRSQITLVFDEYMANVLALLSTDKKKGTEMMRMVSEILMVGRTLGVRLVICCQRPDATAFPAGSRLNYGIIIALGAPIKSLYEMIMPKEYLEKIGDQKFERGEGIVIQQNSDMKYIKIPCVRDVERMQKVCIEALSREILPDEGGGEATSPQTVG